MKEYFGWLLEDTWYQTNHIFHWKDEKRDKAYKQQQLGVGPKAITVNSSGWISEGNETCMRYARFQSNLIDIATIMIYPTASPDQLPVFAAEWVAVQNNIHVIVLDIECLEPINNIPLAKLENLKKKWTIIFPDNNEKPPWFAEIESPWAIFSKSTTKQLESLRTMYAEYLLCACDHMYIKNLDESLSGGDHKRVCEYKKHHAKHSPARKIVNIDNAIWLDNFLTDNHFKILY